MGPPFWTAAIAECDASGTPRGERAEEIVEQLTAARRARDPGAAKPTGSLHRERDRIDRGRLQGNVLPIAHPGDYAGGTRLEGVQPKFSLSAARVENSRHPAR